MTRHVVTPENWNDPAFWRGVAVHFDDTLDLTRLGAGFEFSANLPENLLLLSHAGATFTIGGAGRLGTDSNLGSGQVDHFGHILGVPSEGDDTETFGTEAQSTGLGGGENTVRLEGGHDKVQAGVLQDVRDVGDVVKDDDLGHPAAGRETVQGGSRKDHLVSGSDDHLHAGGAGRDSMDRGHDAGRMTDLSQGASIDGAAGGLDADTLDLTGSVSPGGALKVVTDGVDSDGNGLDGMVRYFDRNGDLEGVLFFSNIETIVPCFVAGTMIRTEQGDRPVECLRPGDAVLTRDNGFQTLRWIGHRHLSMDDLAKCPHLRPIEIAPSALGAHQPSLPLLVSPQHRVLLHGFGSDLLYGAKEVLVAASHLLDWDYIREAKPRDVTYVHMLFDRHEIVLSNGAWTESFQPGDLSLTGMDADQRGEVFDLFPSLKDGAEPHAFTAARPTLKRHEAALLRPLDDHGTR